MSGRRSTASQEPTIAASPTSAAPAASQCPTAVQLSVSRSAGRPAADCHHLAAPGNDRTGPGSRTTYKGRNGHICPRERRQIYNSVDGVPVQSARNPVRENSPGTKKKSISASVRTSGNGAERFPRCAEIPPSSGTMAKQLAKPPASRHPRMFRARGPTLDSRS